MSVRTGTAVTRRTAAHAKINLGIAVTTTRSDGYHELRSVFLRLALADVLIVRPAAGPRDELVIEGDPDCPVDDNLVLAAAGAFRDVAGTGLGPDPLAIRLEKRIPMAAGLAGGSSDAAAMLRLLARSHPDVADPLTLRTVAARIGSDVPFFVGAAGAALVSGVGELVEPLPPPIEPLGVLLVTPPVAMPTPAVFRAWDALSRPGGDRGPTSRAADAVETLASELRAGATPAMVIELAAALRDANDLWPAATTVEPALDAWRDDLERLLGRPVSMSGSGSTLVALYPDPAAASEAAVRLGSVPALADRGARITATTSTSPYPPDIDTIEEAT